MRGDDLRKIGCSSWTAWHRLDTRAGLESLRALDGEETHKINTAPSSAAAAGRSLTLIRRLAIERVEVMSADAEVRLLSSIPGVAAFHLQNR